MVLTHLTEKIESLRGIINEGFMVKYCYEILRAGYNGEQFHAAFPMISFSELELSNLGKLKNTYGGYGITLTKIWAEANALNPVIYLEKNSILLSQIKKSFDLFWQETPVKGEDKYEHFNLLNSIFAYSKNYIETLSRANKEDIPDYVFAEEREWRLVIDDERRLLGLKPFYFSLGYCDIKSQINETIKDLKIPIYFKDIVAIHINDIADKDCIVECLKNKFSLGINDVENLEFIVKNK